MAPKCGNCGHLLVCKYCGYTFSFTNHQAYEAFYDRTAPVPCPNCRKILVCRQCGYVCDPYEEEYNDEERRR